MAISCFSSLIVAWRSGCEVERVGVSLELLVRVVVASSVSMAVGVEEVLGVARSDAIAVVICSIACAIICFNWLISVLIDKISFT